MSEEQKIYVAQKMTAIINQYLDKNFTEKEYEDILKRLARNLMFVSKIVEITKEQDKEDTEDIFNYYYKSQEELYNGEQ